MMLKMLDSLSMLLSFRINLEDVKAHFIEKLQEHLPTILPAGIHK